jgi:hypothetical protein
VGVGTIRSAMMVAGIGATRNSSNCSASASSLTVAFTPRGPRRRRWSTRSGKEPIKGQLCLFGSLCHQRLPPPARHEARRSRRRPCRCPADGEHGWTIARSTWPPARGGLNLATSRPNDRGRSVVRQIRLDPPSRRIRPSMDSVRWAWAIAQDASRPTRIGQGREHDVRDHSAMNRSRSFSRVLRRWASETSCR